MSPDVQTSAGTTVIALEGELDDVRVRDLWEDVVGRARAAGTGSVVVDATKLSEVGGTGLLLLAEIRRTVVWAGGTIEMRGLTADQASLVERAVGHKPPEPREEDSHFVSDVGETAFRALDELADTVRFIGEAAIDLAYAIRHPRSLRWRDLLRVMGQSGIDSMPVTCMLSGIVGFIIAYQMMPALDRYGAADQTPTIMGFAIIRELGPLITAIILAGRSGSAFAAEIGTMKVTEEVNALTTMGLNPERFLVTPRVLAVAITTPLLSVFASFAGVLGGWLPMVARDMSLELYLQSVRNSIDQVDFLQGVFKAFVFAVVIGGIGCRSGLKTQVGPGAVGASTTRAVVAGIVAIIVLDGVLVGLFHALGI